MRRSAKARGQPDDGFPATPHGTPNKSSYGSRSVRDHPGRLFARRPGVSDQPISSHSHYRNTRNMESSCKDRCSRSHTGTRSHNRNHSRG